jgi:ribosomal protein L13E
MASNHPMQANFGLLPEPQGRFGSFGVSLVINISVAALLVLFAAAGIHEVHARKENTAVLIFPVEPPKPYIPPPPKVHVVAPPPKVEPPKRAERSFERGELRIAGVAEDTALFAGVVSD